MSRSNLESLALMPSGRNTWMSFGAILIVAGALCIASDRVASAAPVVHSTTAPASPVMTLSGAIAADGDMTISLCGAGPPGPGGSQPFVLVIKLNDWTVPDVKIAWNDETGCWEGTYHIPPGQTGATVSVLAVGHDGSHATASAIVH